VKREIGLGKGEEEVEEKISLGAKIERS